jgi:hypothetical protein
MNGNMDDVNRLLKIHKDITGDERGRRYGVEVLNKSAVVLITACWEAFVEDLASEAYEFLLTNASSAADIPAKVRSLASTPLKEAADTTQVWQLAGDGWKAVLQTHKTALLDRYIGTFNTPKPDNVDALLEGLIGLKSLSSQWYWKGMSFDRARAALLAYVEDRGAIAHRTRTSSSITKAYVRGYRDFAFRLAVRTTNTVRTHLHSLVKKNPWAEYNFKKTT